MRTIDDFTRPEEYVSPLDGLLGSLFREWAEREVMPLRRRFDEDWLEHELIHAPMKSLLVDYGFQRFFFPVEQGGLDLGNSDNIWVVVFRLLEEMARADSGMCIALAVVLWPLMFITIQPHVNRRLCAEFAPMYMGPEPVFSALAMTEPQGGADIENVDLLRGSTIQTTAIRDGDEWVVNGHKLWPTNTGGEADLLAVVCTTNPGSNDPDDIAVIYVPTDLPGVTQGPPYEKAGMAADKNGDTWFEDVRVPLWYRAHGPGDDALYFGEIVTVGNGLSTALASGVMMNVWEKLVEFVNCRTYRGLPLKENDAVAGVLAEYVASLEAVRIMGYQTARMCDRPHIYGERWSHRMIAKSRAHRMFAADRCLECVGTAMNLMEAYGADRDRDVEKQWRDIKMVQLWLGGKQLCQMEVARWYLECETL